PGRSTRRSASRLEKRSRSPQLEALEHRITPTIVFNPQFGAVHVSDGNGDVLNDVPIYLIFNGAFWNTSPGGTDPKTQVEDALKAVIDGPYLSGTHQYRWNLPGQPFLAGKTQDPNQLSDGFGFVGPNIGFSFTGVSIDFLPTGTLCGN